jgi:hypothetical protein
VEEACHEVVEKLLNVDVLVSYDFRMPVAGSSLSVSM